MVCRPCGSCGRSLESCDSSTACWTVRRIDVAAPRDVLLEVVEKRNDSCGTNATARCNCGQRYIAHVAAVDGDAAGPHVVHAGDEADQRRLAVPVGPTMASVVPGRHIDGDIAEHSPVEVAEADVVERDASPYRRKRLHARGIDDYRPPGQHLLYALHRCGCLLVQVERPAEVDHRHRQKHDVAVELHELPERDRTGLDLQRADVDYDDGADTDEHRQQGPERH